MKRLLASTLLALGASAQWYTQTYNLVASTYMTLDLVYDINANYYTTYKAGDGPYYTSGIFPSCTADYHYEEYGAASDLSAVVQLTMTFPQSGSDDWRWDVFFNANPLTVKPYRQAIWWPRVLGMIADGNTPTGSVYVGGVYDFQIGKAYMSYCESASTYSEEYFDMEYNNRAWIDYTDATAVYTAKGTKARNCWNDKKLSVELYDHLPASIQAYVGTQQIYEQALFSF